MISLKLEVARAVADNCDELQALRFGVDVDNFEDIVVCDVLGEGALGFYHQLPVEAGIYMLEEGFGSLLFCQERVLSDCEQGGQRTRKT